MRHSPIGTKWCHIRWFTYRRREHFKIAATAQFCERVVGEACHQLGWSPDTIAVLADGVQLLVLVPAEHTRERLRQDTREIANRIARHAGLAPMPGRVWEDSWWCAVLTNAAAVSALRRHIDARKRTESATGFNTSAATSRL